MKSDVPSENRLIPGFLMGLCFLLILGACLADVTKVSVLITLGIIIMAALVYSRVPLRLMFIRILPLVPFIILTFLALFLLAPLSDKSGETITLFNRSISAQGFEFVKSLSIKSVFIVVITLALFHNLSQRDFLSGLISLRLPTMVISLCYLIIYSLNNVNRQVQSLHRAGASRGVVHGWRKVTTLMHMTQALLIRLARRAEMQSFALAARNFTGAFPLASVKPVSWKEATALLFCATAYAGLLFFV